MFSATSAVPTLTFYTDSEPAESSGTDDDEPKGPTDTANPQVGDDHDFSLGAPLPPIDSPTAKSPGHVTESDSQRIQRRIRQLMNKDDEDEEEEEEHIAQADSAIVVPVDEPIFPPEGTEPVIPPPSTNITNLRGLRITINLRLPYPSTRRQRLETLSPTPCLLHHQSPPISLSPPLCKERLVRCLAQPAQSPPLLSASGVQPKIQTLRIASHSRALIDAVTAALPSPPLPPSLYVPPLLTEVGESSTARPTKGQGIDYGFVSTVDAEERRQWIRGVGYEIRGTWVDPAEAVPEIAPMTVEKVNIRVTELAELHEHDTQDLYAY
ncbi:hypothetical protein Tco_0331995 [Tanacetum coccineum]